MKNYHLISYAYPSSTLAAKLGFAASGVWVIRTEKGEDLTFDNKKECFAAAACLGSQPSRWSHDHPLNNVKNENEA